MCCCLGHKCIIVPAKNRYRAYQLSVLNFTISFFSFGGLIFYWICDGNFRLDEVEALDSKHAVDNPDEIAAMVDMWVLFSSSYR